MHKQLFLNLIKKKGWAVKEGVSVKLKNGDVKFIEEGAWSQGEDLINEIGSYDVKHMTRVVGYYSDPKNWNKSKLGELADRHKGDYVVKDWQEKAKNV